MLCVPGCSSPPLCCGALPLQADRRAEHSQWRISCFGSYCLPPHCQCHGALWVVADDARPWRRSRFSRMPSVRCMCTAFSPLDVYIVHERTLGWGGGRAGSPLVACGGMFFPGFRPRVLRRARVSPGILGAHRWSGQRLLLLVCCNVDLARIQESQPQTRFLRQGGSDVGCHQSPKLSDRVQCCLEVKFDRPSRPHARRDFPHSWSMVSTSGTVMWCGPLNSPSILPWMSFQPCPALKNMPGSVMIS